MAALARELFTAVDAQQEALRLDPERLLYRANLARLLALPYRRFESAASNERDERRSSRTF